MKLSSTLSRCSAFNKELLGVFEALRHFQHDVNGLLLIIDAYHNYMTFKQLHSSAKYIDQDIREFEYVYQFISDIRPCQAKQNTIADALSRMEDYAIADVSL